MKRGFSIGMFSFSLALSLGFVFFVAAQESWLGGSQLDFSTGSTWVSSLQESVYLGQTGSLTGFDVRIQNLSTDPYTLRLGFVNQTLTADGMGNVSCDMVSGASFGQYFSWNQSPFVVSPNAEIVQHVAINYPLCMSGVFAGCAVQMYSGNAAGNLDVVLGKVNLISFLVHPASGCMDFVVKVFPGSRPGANFENKGELRLYDMSHQLVAQGMVTTNTYGTGIFSGGVLPGTYYAVYKGQSHLASYINGLVIGNEAGLMIDFTTGMNLNNVQNKSLTQDDGYKYQIAGDLKNIQNSYDFMINGNDIAILTMSGFIEGGIPSLDPKNLNADDSINISDISVIGVGFEHTDPFLASQQFVW